MAAAGPISRHLRDQELERAVDAMVWPPRHLPYEAV